MVRVTAAHAEPDRTVAQTPRLALNSRKLIAVVDHDVAPRVLAKRKEHAEALALETKKDGKR
jgi:hypothetical protein